MLSSDFNPRAPYGARLYDSIRHGRTPSISIHAPHTGRDCQGVRLLLEERVFQSTRPIRGATPLRGHTSRKLAISIHAPHTGRDLMHKGTSAASWSFQSTRPIRGATVACAARKSAPIISIHAPHTGRDVFSARRGPPLLAFQSTRPIRGATLPSYFSSSPSANFNPRAPYGARRR